MNKALILIIEGQHAEFPAFASGLHNKGFEVESALSGNKAFALLGKGINPDLAIVNAATLRTNGKRICQSLREASGKLPILLILDKTRHVENVDADCVLHLPFTIQKLTNRIRTLLPGDGKNNIHAGPIRVDPETKMVFCQKKKARLTPRLIRLLRVLIEHKGEALERNRLFSQIWETDYTEDTRTLDVHISWLRQAIEEDPQHPRFIKTVRGVGYRLDI